jgi:hypothetical protein
MFNPKSTAVIQYPHCSLFEASVLLLRWHPRGVTRRLLNCELTIAFDFECGI